MVTAGSTSGHEGISWKQIREKIARAIMLPQLSREEAKRVRTEVAENAELTQNYVLMCGLSAGIATLGLLQSSTAVVIGAMLISPLMAPIAAMGFGFAALDGKTIRDGSKVVLIGAAVGIAVGMLVTWLSPIRDATPEILARTQPSLLDLAVALLSGIAGGYATVMQKGGTVVGVAIATALMPPLATVGYGIATGEPRYAVGALLLFLTNLAAIAFAFAIIARLSGIERPATHKKMTPRLMIIGVLSFLLLATPLAMSLVRITHETTLRSDAKQAIETVMGAGTEVPQIEVNWPFGRDPEVHAIVVVPDYSARGVEDVQQQLNETTNRDVSVQLQQIVASNENSRSDAAVDAAMERTIAGINADSPPITDIRSAIGLPTTAMWVNRSERTVSFQAVSAPGWNLANYRAAEEKAEKVAGEWLVHVHPPARPELRIRLGSGGGSGAVSSDLAIWALERWGIGNVTISMPKGSAGDNLVSQMKSAGIKVDRKDGGTAGTAIVQVYAPPPDPA